MGKNKSWCVAVELDRLRSTYGLRIRELEVKLAEIYVICKEQLSLESDRTMEFSLTVIRDIAGGGMEQ